jgi:hypothetical protein
MAGMQPWAACQWDSKVLDGELLDQAREELLGKPDLILVTMDRNQLAHAHIAAEA